jgi:ABC-type multidrug transport system fused ATPase/permease subunit
MPKVTVARALTARVASRVLRIATIVAGCGFFVVLLIIWALAYFFSPWWWLLLIPFVVLFTLFLFVRLLVRIVIRRVHGQHLNKTQREGLDSFIDKLQAIAEARATPWPLIIAICLKDLVFHRDITTVKQLINDTTSLRHDYKTLETLF